MNNVKNYCDQHGEDATLEGYLEDIALISDIDSYNESADQVVLMTIHSAKGLEFPVCVPHRDGRGRVPQRDEQVF